MNEPLFLTEVTYQRLLNVECSLIEKNQLWDFQPDVYMFCGRPVIIIDENGIPEDGEMSRVFNLSRGKEVGRLTQSDKDRLAFCGMDAKDMGR